MKERLIDELNEHKLRKSFSRFIKYIKSDDYVGAFKLAYNVGQKVSKVG